MNPEQIYEDQAIGIAIGLACLFFGLITLLSGRHLGALSWVLTATALMWLSLELGQWYKVYLKLVAMESKCLACSFLAVFVYFFAYWR